MRNTCVLGAETQVNNLHTLYAQILGRAELNPDVGRFDIAMRSATLMEPGDALQSNHCGSAFSVTQPYSHTMHPLVQTS